MAEVREALGIPGIDVETARNFRDKDRMKRILNEAGLPCAQHRLVGGPEEAMSFIEKVGFPVVAKPPAGSGSRNTFRINNPDQARDWLQWSPPEPDRPTLLEEFVVGDEHAFDCVFVDGRPRWWNISRYHPTPLEVMENPWIQWAVVLAPRHIRDPSTPPSGRPGRLPSPRSGCEPAWSTWSGSGGPTARSPSPRLPSRPPGRPVLDLDLLRSRLRPLLGLGSFDDLWGVRSTGAAIRGGCRLLAGPG